MGDVVERLRTADAEWFDGGAEVLRDAAAELLRLRAEAARLREALRGLMRVMPLLPKQAKHIVGMEQQYNDALRAATTALAGEARDGAA